MKNSAVKKKPNTAGEKSGGKKTENDGRSAEVRALNRTLGRSLRHFSPPEGLTVDEWADKYRQLPAANAESGLWRTSRTPYLREIMRAFTDPNVEDITIAAGSQVGKTECMLNMLGYIIDQDPANVLFIQPDLEEAKKFSRQRIKTLIDANKRLKAKVRDVGSRQSDTLLQKTFPGGSLTIVGTNSAPALASIPCRYVFGDERDRFADSAGDEGDPWGLAKARQQTFYNKKRVQVSTPTVKGRSKIEKEYNEGTRERWCVKCPACGEFHNIDFDDIRFDAACAVDGARKQWKLNGPVLWVCPDCGAAHSEKEMRAQEAKWIADAPENYKKGRRSFWLSAFSSPWTPWDYIVLRFLEAKDNPRELQTVFNTLLGRCWEDRVAAMDEETLYNRREDYGLTDEGVPVEVPDGALVLTCGVDVQDDRLEYEVVGYGLFGESWGISRGVIGGRPDTEAPWERLDGVLRHGYRRRDGREEFVRKTCVDSGGHFTQEVYLQTWRRASRNVVAIKGQGGEDRRFIPPATWVPVRNNPNCKTKLYTLGVDAGKTVIMANVKVQEPGPGYMHFPNAPQAGYDMGYFSGLLSETKEITERGRSVWVKLPGHERNEPLDCRNYANAAVALYNPDMDRELRRVKGQPEPEKPKPAPVRSRVQRNSLIDGGEW